MKFSIGYNGKDDFASLIHRYANVIHSVYLPLPSDVISSGRGVVQGEKYHSEILRIIAACQSKNILSIWLLNASCEWDKTGEKGQLSRINDSLKFFHERGLWAVSLTNMLYVGAIRQELPLLKIYASINCYVKSSLHARYIAKLGVDVITIDRDINRDLTEIRKIKKETGKELQILLNEGCVQDCPFRMTHFNILAHCSDEHALQDSNLIEWEACTPFLRENRRRFFQIPFVRPEDLHHYTWLVDIFKLTTRTLGTKEIERQLVGYASERYDGNLIDMLDMWIFGYEKYVPYVDNTRLNRFDFFQEMQRCPHDCDKCSNCDKYF